MKKGMKQKRIGIGIGIVGLVAVFLLGKALSSGIYRWQENGEQSQGSGEGGELEPPKAALTEEELEELFRTAKEKAMLSGQREDADSSLEAGDATGVEEAGSNGPREVSEEESRTSGEDAAAGVIDFAYLQESVNGDIYAWITIPGTNIDYPILQHPTDDSFYLNHNLDGSYGYPGCIYTESLNAKDFTDPNTLIYGHNLKSRTMFSELHKFESRDFFEEHSEVIVYLPGQTLHYQIFAVHVYDDRHVLYSFDFTDEDIYAGYLQSIYDIRDMSANINRNFEVTKDDRILTLSTCVSGKANAEKRLHVHAVLLEDM